MHSFCKTKNLILLLFSSEQMGRIQCPLLAVLGEDDQIRPSYESVMDVSVECCWHALQRAS